ncbi:SPOR domain-containing protein [Sulfitobacter sp. TSTF-M16]|uniref:SPOR domain-containing protein n=2 Tax=Sulfitobacter aestuariivivens TaxID=2766981 RepID=A0A927D4P0_9RHOB|nr:SPOR domain-containing protein [Sulfitobacter aestuariivivens]
MLAATLGTSVGEAQIRQQQPAEFPPATYKGKQYVDSKGCVFIRAGIDGDVSWVPRVTRDRKTVCGFKPSLAPSETAAAPTPVAPPAVAPEQITIDSPQLASAKPARNTLPAPAPRPTVVRQTAAKPRVAATAQRPAQAVARPKRHGATACPEASDVAQPYLQNSRHAPVRCGPQTEPIAGLRSQKSVPQTGVARRHTAVTRVDAHTRIVPKHVAINRLNTTNVTVPKGYKTAWDDDRLNPRRAEQNLAGRQDMLLIWTQTVPRRLINQSTGRDVTATVPLVYPYLDLATQSRELGEVSIVQRDGKVAKRIIRNPGVKRTTVRQPTYSTRSAPASEPPKAPAQTKVAGRYVQIGIFGDPANAQRTAQRIARMGYPARIGTYRKAGKTYSSVQAGPFTRANKLRRAVSRLRGAGYADAFVRK